MISSSFVRLGLLLFILSFAAGSQDTKGNTCMKNGGYCQTHWECCSRKCMTYLNQCAKRIGSSYPYPYGHDVPHPNGLEISGPNKPANKYDDSLQIVGLPNESRPSGNTFDIVRQNEISGSTVPYKCRNVGETCYRGEECCSMRCHFYMHKCVT